LVGEQNSKMAVSTLGKFGQKNAALAIAKILIASLALNLKQNQNCRLKTPVTRVTTNNKRICHNN
jgi:hypothetical protein